MILDILNLITMRRHINYLNRYCARLAFMCQTSFGLGFVSSKCKCSADVTLYLDRLQFLHVDAYLFRRSNKDGDVSVRILP